MSNDLVKFSIRREYRAESPKVVTLEISTIKPLTDKFYEKLYELITEDINGKQYNRSAERQ